MIEDLDELTAISPLDGRYARHTQGLRLLVSEYGLIRARCIVELRWFQHLAATSTIPELPPLSKKQSESIEKVITKFSLKDAKKVKSLEARSNHDVKAVEYLIKDKIAAIEGLSPFSEFVHFACTSEDINNLSHGLMLQAAMEKEIIPSMINLIEALAELAEKYAGTAMLSRTHGQIASPTTMGKELANWVARLRRQLIQIKDIKILGIKFHR